MPAMIHTKLGTGITLSESFLRLVIALSFDYFLQQTYFLNYSAVRVFLLLLLDKPCQISFKVQYVPHRRCF